MRANRIEDRCYCDNPSRTNGSVLCQNCLGNLPIMKPVDIDRISKLDKAMEENPHKALDLLYEWIKTGKINRTTFKYWINKSLCTIFND